MKPKILKSNSGSTRRKRSNTTSTAESCRTSCDRYSVTNMTITTDLSSLTQDVTALAKKAKEAAAALALLDNDTKNKALLKMSAAVRASTAAILRANKEDVDAAVAGGMKKAFVDRLTLNEE